MTWTYMIVYWWTDLDLVHYNLAGNITTQLSDLVMDIHFFFYPLVNSHIAFENHNLMPFGTGKPTVNRPFSIAIVNYRIVISSTQISVYTSRKGSHSKKVNFFSELVSKKTWFFPENSLPGDSGAMSFLGISPHDSRGTCPRGFCLQEPCCRWPRSANVASGGPRWTKARPDGAPLGHGQRKSPQIFQNSSKGWLKPFK